MGSFVFSMASNQALTEIAESDFHKHVDIKEVIQHLVPFVALASNKFKRNETSLVILRLITSEINCALLLVTL